MRILRISERNQRERFRETSSKDARECLMTPDAILHELIVHHHVISYVQ